MLLSNKEKSDTSLTRLITSDDFQDGLDLCTGNYKADTSFLNVFLSLTNFIRIEFKCTSSSGNTYKINNGINTGEPSKNYRNYFSNNEVDRPSCNSITSDTIDCDDVQDGLMSSNNVTINERTYKDIVVLTNGTRMSLTDDNEECFEGPEDIDFSITIR